MQSFLFEEVGDWCVHLGSQSFARRLPAQEHAYETRHLLAARPGDLFVSRFFDSAFELYYQQLLPGVRFFSPTAAVHDPRCLSEIILCSPSMLSQLQSALPSHGNGILCCFFPTLHEKRLACALGLRLWGQPAVSRMIGSKSGARDLARRAGLPIPPGGVADRLSKANALVQLLSRIGHERVVIKSERGMSGRGVWIQAANTPLPVGIQRRLLDGERFVIEAFLPHRAVLGAHLEIDPAGDVQLAGEWIQQVRAGVSYDGARPNTLPESARRKLHTLLQQVGAAIVSLSGVGSYGPDLLWLGEDDFALIEINARIPATSFPLAFLRHLNARGVWRAIEVDVEPAIDCTDTLDRLSSMGLLLEAIDQSGPWVLPYNHGRIRFAKLNLLLFGEREADCDLVERQARMLLRAKSLHPPQPQISIA